MELTKVISSSLPSLPVITADFKRAATQKYDKFLRRYHRHVFESAPPPKRPEFFDDPKTKTWKFTQGKHNFNAMYIPADNPTDLVLLVTGCKSSTKYWNDQVNDLLENGKSVFVMNTTVPGRQTGFHQDNLDAFNYLMFDKNSPLQKIRERTALPLQIIAHSFGGQALLWSYFGGKKTEEWRREILSLNTKLRPYNPFLSSKSLNPRRLLGPLKRPFYLNDTTKIFGHKLGHAFRNTEKRYGDCLSDIFYQHWAKAKGEPMDIRTSTSMPAHPQVAEMQDGGDNLFDLVEKNGVPDYHKNADIHFWIGGKDYLSDVKANKDFTKLIKKTCTIFKKCWHNPWHEKPEEVSPIIMRSLGKSPPREKQITPVTPTAFQNLPFFVRQPQAASTSAPERAPVAA